MEPGSTLEALPLRVPSPGEHHLRKTASSPLVTPILDETVVFLTAFAEDKLFTLPRPQDGRIL
jgi:hypothetical protein